MLINQLKDGGPAFPSNGGSGDVTYNFQPFFWAQGGVRGTTSQTRTFNLAVILSVCPGGFLPGQRSGHLFSITRRSVGI